MRSCAKWQQQMGNLSFLRDFGTLKEWPNIVLIQSVFIRVFWSNQITVRWGLCLGTRRVVESRWFEGWSVSICCSMPCGALHTAYLDRSRSVPGGMSVLLVPRLRLCVPRDYPSHTTRRRPVRYIWLHMATCVMGPKAGDADFQQRGGNGWKKWSHVGRSLLLGGGEGSWALKGKDLLAPSGALVVIMG